LELFGLFWLTAMPRSEKRIAYRYFSQALSVYDQWGAIAKVSMLQEKMSSLVSDDPVQYPQVRQNKKQEKLHIF
jgi:hypothetical protein